MRALLLQSVWSRGWISAAWAVSASCVLMVGCTNSGPGDVLDAAVDADVGTPLPADVDDVLTRNCRKCHTKPTKMGAPFPLLNWQDTQGFVPGNPNHVHISEAMHARVNDHNFPMPPDDSLSATDRATLNAWYAAGSPAGR